MSEIASIAKILPVSYRSAHRVFISSALLSAGLFVFSPAYAQENFIGPQETAEARVAKHIRRAKEKNFLSFSYENDLIGGGTDQYYTSGVRATYFNVNTDVPPIMDELADAIPTFDLNETTSTFFTLGQNIFTPQDITLRGNQDRDRPWAAWLYGSVGLATLSQNHIDEMEVTIGVVGPEALGEQTQKLVHKHVTDSPTPRGWDNQIGFEPGVIISGQRRWFDFWDARVAGLEMKAVPNVNVSLGNIYTYAGTGMTFTIGPYQDILQDTPPRVRPAMPGSGYFETPDQGWSWHGFASIDGRAVARDIFLDGNTFRDSHSVDKNVLVGDVSAGIAMTIDRYRLSYAVNARSKEFDGQDGSSIFGSLTFSTRF